MERSVEESASETSESATPERPGAKHVHGQEEKNTAATAAAAAASELENVAAADSREPSKSTAGDDREERTPSRGEPSKCDGKQRKKSKSRRRVWIGFDLGGTKMLAKAYDENFNELGGKRKKTKAHEGAESSLARLQTTIEAVLENAEVGPGELAGIGVGCPGPLDLKRGIVHEAPNLGWNDVPLQQILEKRFDCPARICNDVDAGVFGEYRFGAGRGARCVVGVFPGTGIGGGCVYDGRILQGRSFSCFEIGHVIVDPNGPRCGCGQYGCLEAVASRTAVAAAAAQAALRGQAPALKKNAGADLEKIRSGALAAAVEDGDTVVRELVERAAQAIGIALVGVVHLLAPDVIVLGGGLVEALPKLISKTVERTLEANLLKTFVGSYKVAVAELGDDSTVLGAAAWAKELIAAESAGTKK